MHTRHLSSLKLASTHVHHQSPVCAVREGTWATRLSWLQGVSTHACCGGAQLVQLSHVRLGAAAALRATELSRSMPRFLRQRCWFLGAFLRRSLPAPAVRSTPRTGAVVQSLQAGLCRVQCAGCRSAAELLLAGKALRTQLGCCCHKAAPPT